MKPSPSATRAVPEAALRWIAGRDTGLSSKTIWAHMVGIEPAPSWMGDPPPHPLDPDDLGRCVRLFVAVPEWRGRIPELGAISPEWRALAEHWDELEMLYHADRANVEGRLCGTRMRELLDPFRVVQQQESRVIRGGSPRWPRPR